jgi:hypothetical protein
LRPDVAVFALTWFCEVEFFSIPAFPNLSLSEIMDKEQTLKKGSLVVNCIHNTGKKVEIPNQSIDHGKQLKRLTRKKFKYIFEDAESGDKTDTDYRMIIAEK